MPGSLVDGEVVDGEPARHRRSQRRRFDHRLVAGLGERGPGVAGAVGGVAQHLPVPVARRSSSRTPHHPVAGCCAPVALVSAQLGDDAGVGFDRDVGLVAVLAASARSCARAGRRDPRWRSPGPRRPAGRSATRPSDAARSPTGSTSCPATSASNATPAPRHRPAPGLGQMPPARGAHHRPARRPARSRASRVVPGDPRLARAGVVVGPAVARDHLGRAGHLTGHPADRGDQLGDRVLGGDRVVEDRGVHRPAGLAASAPRSAPITCRTASKIRFGACRAAQPAPPLPSTWSDGTRSSVTANPHATFHRRSNVTPRPPRGPTTRSTLQHDHRGDHLGRHRRAPTPR